MKKLSLSALTLGAVCLLSASASAQVTVFSDTFGNGSTIMAATPAAPTASSTDYAVMSSKNASGSTIGAGSLNLGIPATSAGFAEIQALFTSSPVTLGAGDSIMLQMTFQSTHLLDINDGNTQTINVGLYNSGGSYPVPGGQMANGGMGSGTAFVTGYAQDWEGYVGRVGTLNGGNSSQIYTRDPQTDTVDENQDVLFNNSGTGAYDTPTGQGVAGSGDQINITDGTDYTMTFEISYDGTDVTVAQNIYEGADTAGANVYSLSGQAPAGYAYTTFDSLAFGFRGRNTDGQEIHWNVSGLDIITRTVPEPSSLALLGLGGLALLIRRRS